MYNEITRKLTSLTLATIMLAGGMTFMAPGMVPMAHAAGDLYVSAEAVGNFAGIQVLEIVVSDPARSDTDTTEGRPNVEINNNEVYMAQATDGSWYAYVVNQNAIDNYANFNDIFNSDIGDANTIANSEALVTYANATSFLDGYKTINTAFNNDVDAEDNWPFIQSYEISTNSDVTIRYGTGGTADTVAIQYEYDDTKDITLDRTHYPGNSFIHITTDDSLLNLSPIADDTWIFYANGTTDYYIDATVDILTHVNYAAIGFEEGPITTSNPDDVFIYVDTGISSTINEDAAVKSIILKTSNTDDNLFVNYDNTDKSGLKVVQNGQASIAYNSAHSVLYDTFNGVINFVNFVDEWYSGVELILELTDEDRNFNSRTDEVIDILEGEVPYIEIGNPITISGVDSIVATNATGNYDILPATSITGSLTGKIIVPENATLLTINATWPYPTDRTAGHVLNYINFDLSKLGGQSGTFLDGLTPLGVNTDNSNSTLASYVFNIDTAGITGLEHEGQIYFDIFSFGQQGEVADIDGDINANIDRVNDAIYRFSLEETDDNTAKFEGTVEYIMINQLNLIDPNLYSNIETADDQLVIIVNDDSDGTDAIRVSYEDTDSTSTIETISVQEDANTHSGQISLDKTAYSQGNTITVTLIDSDLNTDSDTVQSYTVDPTTHKVGKANVWLVEMTIDDQVYDDSCGLGLGLYDTGFTLTETSDQSGVFTGTLKLPALYCENAADLTGTTTNGLDVDFAYQDYSDASGKPNETSNNAAVQSNTGSVSLDSRVYPVPFLSGQYKTFDGLTSLGEGAVLLTIAVDDPDYNISASGEDKMPTSDIELKISRGSVDFVVPILESELLETDPASGIFEVDVKLAQGIFVGVEDQFINQGDIISVTYSDPNDAGGDINTVTDSATFDLRNAVLQSDKTVYIIGADAIITLIEPDLNLDSNNVETWSLDLINWDSDAGDTNLSNAIFNAQPSGLRETGEDTGIFQVVIEFPDRIGTDNIERGEFVTLEYQDNGPAGADYIGDDDEDILLSIESSDFGATVTLDQKVYTWTDKVYVTIVAPDHNFDDKSIDEIGGVSSEITISTRGEELEFYKLVETGADTGIFTGEVILTGFADHDADGDGTTGDATEELNENGPTGGKLPAGSDDGLTVSFENSDRDFVVGSSLIRWNIGETQWLESSYPATGNGIIRVIDPDMNLKPESVDSFEINVWSDSAVGGINLRVTETNEATGIFEGTVIFTVTDSSSGSRLRVSEGDTVTAEYEDNTLPDPYSKADELGITATTFIGSIVPPLERTPATNLRAVDAFGNSLSTLSVDQQIQVTADLSNDQEKDQKFAYLLQVQDESGVTVSLSWITGELTPGQAFSPAVSWIPEELGVYTATTFVWESVDNPTALSPPVSTELNVNN